MSGIVGSKFNHRGSGLVGSLGTDGQYMLSSGAGKTNVFETVADATYDDEPIKADITALALREATNEASAAFNLPSSFIETFTDDTNLGTQTTVDRASGMVASVYTVIAQFTSDSNTVILAHMDDTGLTDSSSNSLTTAFGSGGGVARSGTQSKFGSYSAYSDGSTNTFMRWTGLSGSTTGGVGTGNFTMEYWFHCTALNTSVTNRTYSIGNQGVPGVGGAPSQNQITLSGGFSSTTAAQNFYRGASDTFWQPTFSTITAGQWNHLVIMRKGTTLYSAVNGAWATGGTTNNTMMNSKNMETDTNSGTNQDDICLFSRYGATDEIYTGYLDEFRYSKTDRYDETASFTPNEVTSNNATGTLVQSANTVASAKTVVGGTMLYKDNAGTATLGTDLKIYFTCNGNAGSPAWTEAASYNAITPVYSSGIKMVRLGETTCTSGTDVRYKTVWANQASGSKETQLHGIGINY